jgi:hypothetical protein
MPKRTAIFEKPHTIKTVLKQRLNTVLTAVPNFVTHKQLKYSSGNIGGHCCQGDDKLIFSLI